MFKKRNINLISRPGNFPCYTLDSRNTEDQIEPSYLTYVDFKCENNLTNVPYVLQIFEGTHDEAVFGCVLYEGIDVTDGDYFKFNIGSMIITTEISNIINENMRIHGCTENFELNMFSSTTLLCNIYNESKITVDFKLILSDSQSTFDDSLSK